MVLFNSVRNQATLVPYNGSFLVETQLDKTGNSGLSSSPKILFRIKYYLTGTDIINESYELPLDPTMNKILENPTLLTPLTFAISHNLTSILNTSKEKSTSSSETIWTDIYQLLKAVLQDVLKIEPQESTPVKDQELPLDVEVED